MHNSSTTHLFLQNIYLMLKSIANLMFLRAILTQRGYSLQEKSQVAYKTSLRNLELFPSPEYFNATCFSRIFISCLNLLPH